MSELPIPRFGLPAIFAQGLDLLLDNELKLTSAMTRFKQNGGRIGVMSETERTSNLLDMIGVPHKIKSGVPVLDFPASGVLIIQGKRFVQYPDGDSELSVHFDARQPIVNVGSRSSGAGSSELREYSATHKYAFNAAKKIKYYVGVRLSRHTTEYLPLTDVIFEYHFVNMDYTFCAVLADKFTLPLLDYQYTKHENGPPPMSHSLYESKYITLAEPNYFIVIRHDLKGDSAAYVWSRLAHIVTVLPPRIDFSVYKKVQTIIVPHRLPNRGKELTHKEAECVPYIHIMRRWISHIDDKFELGKAIKHVGDGWFSIGTSIQETRVSIGLWRDGEQLEVAP